MRKQWRRNGQPRVLRARELARGVEGLERRVMLSGTGRYMETNQFGGTFINTLNPAINNYCWAAVASDMLAWTKWGLVDNYQSADDLFNTFTEQFSDAGGREIAGIEWFLTGIYPEAGVRGFSQNFAPGGGYQAGIDIGEYIRTPTTQYVMNNIDGWLHEGDGVSLDVLWKDGTGHDVSVWGFTYNPALSPTNPNYYTGVIIGDPDQNYRKNDVIDAPSALQTYALKWDGEKYLMPTYGGGATVDTAAALVPEPAAIADQPDLKFNLDGGFVQGNFGDTGGVYAPGEPLTVRFDVTNVGNGTAAANTVNVEVDGAMVQTVSIPSLMSGNIFNSWFVSLPTLAPGTHTVTLEAVDQAKQFSLLSATEQVVVLQTESDTAFVPTMPDAWSGPITVTKSSKTQDKRTVTTKDRVWINISISNEAHVQQHGSMTVLLDGRAVQSFSFEPGAWSLDDAPFTVGGKTGLGALSAGAHLIKVIVTQAYGTKDVYGYWFAVQGLPLIQRDVVPVEQSEENSAATPQTLVISQDTMTDIGGSLTTATGAAYILPVHGAATYTYRFLQDSAIRLKLVDASGHSTALAAGMGSFHVSGNQEMLLVFTGPVNADYELQLVPPSVALPSDVPWVGVSEDRLALSPGGSGSIRVLLDDAPIGERAGAGGGGERRGPGDFEERGAGDVYTAELDEVPDGDIHGAERHGGDAGGAV